jgi:hypothetical protein
VIRVRTAPKEIAVANWLEKAKATADIQPDKGVFVVSEKTVVCNAL